MRQQTGASLCLFFGLLGLGLAGYLMVPHLGLLRGEILGGVACGPGGVFNCHVVTGSNWGSFLGVPLALWGVVGYITVIALALLARQSADWAAHAMILTFLLAVVLVAIDVFLFSVMTLAIRSLCLLCLLTYAVNLSLLVTSFRSLGRPWREALQGAGAALAALVPSSQRPAAWLFWGMLVVGLLGSAGLHAATTFVNRGSLGSNKEQLRRFVAGQPRVQVDVAGDPRIGPVNAPLRIVEFSDFRCPVCQRASRLNPIVLTNHRGEASFVFKQYPLDTACNDTLQRQIHPGSCQLAAATECAHLQGKFWELHDRIFEEGKDYRVSQLRADVRKLGLDVEGFNACMDSGKGMEAVKRDIAEGQRIEVRSTPTYVINGIRMSGVITPSSFEDLIPIIREGDR